MRPELVIFDCDGVLIDSEALAATVIAQDLSALGWAMRPRDSMKIFLGMSILDMEPIIAAKLGRALPAAWRQQLADKLLAALAEGAKLVPGARQMLEAVTAKNIPWRVASNSSEAEMAVKFARTGLSHLTAGRIHAAASIFAQGGRPKPAPDVFLAAAAAGHAAPRHCIVLEDSPLGVTGAVAAGMVCYGFAPHDDGARLSAAGAHGVFHKLEDFTGFLS